MNTNANHISRLARPKKTEKPRPLSIANQNRHSVLDTRLGTVEEIMALTDTVSQNLANGNYDRTLKTNIINLHSLLKTYGPRLEVIYKDQLDRSFVMFRNGCRDDALDYVSRIHLLELIELRAMQWNSPDNSYYKHKIISDMEVVSTPVLETNFIPTSPFTIASPVALSPAGVQSQQLLLGPGELVKSSGKYPAPTKMAGKNYCKDEVVIRNSDSGKVMGIKGRRVHMIEELSETVISFQRGLCWMEGNPHLKEIEDTHKSLNPLNYIVKPIRTEPVTEEGTGEVFMQQGVQIVNPGAKERLVQITGPSEEKIMYAKQLMEETIRRNASPVRGDGEQERPGSSSSLNTDSDDSVLPQRIAGVKSSLLHSLSTNDASLGEYKYTVTVGEDTIKITGANLDIVRIAKLVLDEYFSPDTNDQYGEFSFEDGQEIFEHIDPYPYISAQGSVDSEETYKAPLQGVTADNTVVKAPEIKSNTQFAKETKGTLAGLRYYTAEEIIRLADSPLSRKTPANWAVISRDFSSILRKTPIEWLDAATLLSCRRPLDDTTAKSHSALLLNMPSDG